MSTNEYRVFGPPGCGKTTFLGAQVTKWASEFGSDALIVGSFTKAAAAEVAGRDLPLRPEQIGTLHAHCFRALGLSREEVAEEHLDDFNERHPGWSLRGGKDASELAFDEGESTGDEAMQECDVLRARMVPVDQWSSNARDFFKVWTEWCAELGVVDFTTMVERGLAEIDRAPGDPRIGLFDEAQDFTPLELALVRKWGEQMDTLLLAGDDDQCIYGFKGSSPDVFLDPPLPPEQMRVLSQSYRVPAAVHRFASTWIEQLSRRQPKEYAPRLDNGETVEGKVRFLTPVSPQVLVANIEQDIADGRSVMLLGTCRHFIRGTITAMRNAGLPFHNPYQRKEGQWNPLVSGGAKRRMAVDKVLSFLRPDAATWGADARMWTYADMLAFIEPMRAAGLLKRGAKTWLQGQIPGDLVDYPKTCMNVWENETSDDVTALENGDLYVFSRLLLATRKPPFDFPLRVIEKRGAAVLRDEPKVVVGTIHSVKGGQADVVYLMPEMSGPGNEQWHNQGRDEITRLFYVGMTRAREELVVCDGRNGSCNELILQAEEAAKGHQ